SSPPAAGTAATSLSTTSSPSSVAIVRSEATEKNPSDHLELRYTQTAVNLREGPGTRFAVITVIPKSTQVVVMAVEGGWSRVRVDQGRLGWMANSTISASPPPRQ
ncbi:MAG TPA: SH3 domain-containing protein, partial [Rhizobium sp.]|nr:SH3 domain-containing protein [Rhizobium sp.]